MKLKFSGHETFPLKFGWLKKVYDICLTLEKEKKTLSDAFIHDTAIADFGVGKNMVKAIKHWAIACKVLEKLCDKDTFSELRISKYGDLLSKILGDKMFSYTGVDIVTSKHWLKFKDDSRFSFHVSNATDIEKHLDGNNLIITHQKHLLQTRIIMQI